VRGRTSDNTLCRELLGWEPTTPLVDGLRVTYDWIERQVIARRERC
jgi:nucleoside-diphosphate-sugar epimerase